MKSPSSSRRPRPSRALAVVPVLLIPPGLAARAQDQPSSEAPESGPPPGRNWIEFSVGGAMVDGDAAAYQRRHGLPEGAYGGIQSYHYEVDLPKDGLLTLDARALFDYEDYSVRLDLNYPERGFFRTGYTQYRTYADLTGGYFPGNELSFPVPDDEGILDRSAFWIEGGLRLPDWPELTLRYERTTRDGTKDSLAWGDTSLTGGAGGRKIVPGYEILDEVRDLIALDARKTLNATTLGVGLRYERQDQDTERRRRRFPTEPLDRYVTQRDENELDLFNVHAFVESRLSEQVLFTTGYAFTDLDADTTGYRVYGTGYDPDLAARLPDPNTFEALRGGSRLSQHLVNLNFMLTPWDSLAVIPSARIEKQDVDGASSFLSPAQPYAPIPYAASSDRGLLDVSEALELRFTGLTNWVLFARANWLQGTGDLTETVDNSLTQVRALDRATDDERFSQKYALGANWYLHRRLNVGAGYYYKLRENDFDSSRDSTSNTPGSLDRYPAFFRAQDLETHDAHVRATWRPLTQLTLVGRYDFQFTTLDNAKDNLDPLTTAEITSHIAGASVSWVPVGRLYLQANLNYVVDETDTTADDATADAVLDSQNDYWTTSLTAGYALGEKTDLEGTYLCYHSDNCVNNSTAGQPYGAQATEHSVRVAISHQLNRRVRVSLGYGFFSSRDDPYGGQNDYDAHLVHSSLQYLF